MEKGLMDKINTGHKRGNIAPERLKYILQEYGNK